MNHLNFSITLKRSSILKIIRQVGISSFKRLQVKHQILVQIKPPREQQQQPQVQQQQLLPQRPRQGQQQLRQ